MSSTPVFSIFTSEIPTLAAMAQIDENAALYIEALNVVSTALVKQSNGEELTEEEMGEAADAGAALVGLRLVAAGQDPEEVIRRLDEADYDVVMAWDPEADAITVQLRWKDDEVAEEPAP